ncbi:uncharacterized protein RJT20DRAFT_123476 [Scheffersomyces xylosifermentans]|uniref:uncharacterized protein n=1 Tax=Scheffersomyces xylosifermentans TaxID=1304137 RepID=UPI00315DD245
MMRGTASFITYFINICILMTAVMASKIENLEKNVSVAQVCRQLEVKDPCNLTDITDIISAVAMGVVYKVGVEYYSIDGRGNYVIISGTFPDEHLIPDYYTLQAAVDDAAADEELKVNYDEERAVIVDEILTEIEANIKLTQHEVDVDKRAL